MLIELENIGENKMFIGIDDDVDCWLYKIDREEKEVLKICDNIDNYEDCDKI